MTLLSVGMVGIDGTKIDADAAKFRSVRDDRAKALRAKSDADIAELMAKAEATDAEDAAPPSAQSNLTDPDSKLMRKSKRTMKTEEAKAKYTKRKQTVEPVFGVVKNVLGFTRFHLRGLENVKNERLPVAMAYNAERSFNLRAA